MKKLALAAALIAAPLTGATAMPLAESFTPHPSA